MTARRFLRRETIEGGPRDSYVRIVDDWYLEADGETATRERRIDARGYIDRIATTVEVREP